MKGEPNLISTQRTQIARRHTGETIRRAAVRALSGSANQPMGFLVTDNRVLSLSNRDAVAKAVAIL